MLGKRPPYTAGLNILVIGSDSRQGLGRKFGSDVLGARSDTSMLLHIAPGSHPGGHHQLPARFDGPRPGLCQRRAGPPGPDRAAGEVERLNATFSAGGAPCLWKTLEQETGIRIQHFVEVNFAGFQSIVNDVRRRAGLPAVRDQQPPGPAAPGGGQAGGQRRAGARVRPAPGEHRRRLGYPAHPAPAVLPGRGHAEAEVDQSAEPAQPDLQRGPRRGEVPDHRQRPGPVHHAPHREQHEEPELEFRATGHRTRGALCRGSRRRAVLGAAAVRPDVPGHRGRPRPAHFGQGQGHQQGQDRERPPRSPRSARPRSASRC